MKPVVAFDRENPFDGGDLVSQHAAAGGRSLRLDHGYAVLREPQNWDGYDYLKTDAYVEGGEPLPITIEIYDSATNGYWTRVNYNTVVPPGASTLTVPIHQLYVGEKSRPGRPLIVAEITQLVFNLGGAKQPLFLSNIRLERDLAFQSVSFDGLRAFDFGTGSSPVMDGFTPVTPATLYSSGRGYGLKNAKVWKAFDVLQPDPLYQDFICIESGGFAIDLPNGKYRVFVNIDSPAGFWGEYQAYRHRSVLAQGRTVVSEDMDFQKFQAKYFRFWDTEDLPYESTFDKYQSAFFSEKTFGAEVNNGQLFIEFEGQAWANSVSAMVVFPVEKAAQGERFLNYVKEKRRFYFDTAFKRVLHQPTGDPLQPSSEDSARGYIVFRRDFMRDVYYNDTPYRPEIGQDLAASGFAGEIVPVPWSILPLKDLGKGTVTLTSLAGPHGSIPPSAVDTGYVSYRLTRMVSDGAIYTIAPRYIMPRNTVSLPKGIARRFWLSVHVPEDAAPGLYSGKVKFIPEYGLPTTVPLQFTVRKGTLDPPDIPIGPFGGPVEIPWMPDDPATSTFEADMTEKSLRLMRAYGFNLFSGMPSVVYRGFKDGEPVLDFSLADRQMADARKHGFRAVNSYGAGVIGLAAYTKDTARMQQAGMQEYKDFLHAIYSSIEAHARAKEWLTVYWNIGDEPASEALRTSIENARAYRAAFPQGPPFFTIATSLDRDRGRGSTFELAKLLHIPMLSLYDEGGVKSLIASGTDWAYYNDANRWTYGIYLYKAATEFGVRFRIGWHWNAAAGDPYYALDCREDDYAWANAGPNGQLLPSLEFVRIAAGLYDYRYLTALARLVKAKPGTPAAVEGENLIRTRMAVFHLSDRDHDKLFGVDDWAVYRRRLAEAMERLQ